MTPDEEADDLRDRMARTALVAILPGAPIGKTWVYMGQARHEEVDHDLKHARQAYRIADAMLRVRKERREP